MKSWYQCLCILLIFTLYLQFTTAYPSSRILLQRSYLRCQLSAVSCKRSYENENSSEMNNDYYRHMCIALNKPFQFCFDQPLYEQTKFIQQIK